MVPGVSVDCAHPQGTSVSGLIFIEPGDNTWLAQLGCSTAGPTASLGIDIGPDLLGYGFVSAVVLTTTTDKTSLPSGHTYVGLEAMLEVAMGLNLRAGMLWHVAGDSSSPASVVTYGCGIYVAF